MRNKKYRIRIGPLQLITHVGCNARLTEDAIWIILPPQHMNTFICIHLTHAFSFLIMYGPRPIKLTGRHGNFLNSTGRHYTYRQRHWLRKYIDMGHWHFLNSTGGRGSIKRQRHTTLTFLKIDIQHQDRFRTVMLF